MIKQENRPRQFAPLNNIYRGRYHYEWDSEIQGLDHKEKALAKAQQMLKDTDYPETILLVGHYFCSSVIFICENFCFINNKITAC